MSNIETKNRNYYFEFIFKCYITFLLKIIGINEEVDKVLSTSLISIDRGENPSLFHNIMDYPVLTKSGKILLFEFKKGVLRTSDFKQLYDYVSKIKRKENREVIPILITIPNKGVINGCFVNFGIFLPMVVKTKSYNKCKDLSIIRYKIENKMNLTTEECSLFVTLPLLETGEDEAKLTGE